MVTIDLPFTRGNWRQSLALTIFSFVALLGFTARADSPAQGIDYSDYDVPLFQQIVSRIESRIKARVGNGTIRTDRYFIVPFAYENRGNDPEFSHSFMSVIHVFPQGRQSVTTGGLQLRQYRNLQFEAFTISWLPRDFLENPHLCVFDGIGGRIIPQLNQCPLSVGKSFDLRETISLAVSVKNAAAMWGPYEIKRAAFDLAVKRTRLLNAGSIKYRADDRLYRKDKVAINCFHALAGLDQLYPNGGLLNTGYKMWGINGTVRVLLEYKSKATQRGLLVDPIDVKKDCYGFVYAPSRDSRPTYNPFTLASVYRR